MELKSEIEQGYEDNRFENTVNITSVPRVSQDTWVIHQPVQRVWKN